MLVELALPRTSGGAGSIIEPRETPAASQDSSNQIELRGAGQGVSTDLLPKLISAMLCTTHIIQSLSWHISEPVSSPTRELSNQTLFPIHRSLDLSGNNPTRETLPLLIPSTLTLLYSHEYTFPPQEAPYPAPENEFPPAELCRI